MGSLGALKGRASDRYASAQGNGEQAGFVGKLVPEGIEGQVPYKGPLADYVFQLVGGLRSGMGYVGARSLEELLAMVAEQANFRYDAAPPEKKQKKP